MPLTQRPWQMDYSGDQSVALYIHVPFCRARCAYCDFNTYAGLEAKIPAYVQALCRESAAAGDRWGPLRISTIYIGGGTPSLLPVRLLSDVLTVVDDTLDLSQCSEFSLEANPGTVDAAYLKDLRAIGIDRLSLGVQSAHDDELGMLGRVHCWNDVLEAVDAARAADFSNLSLDLMFGIPGQSRDGWEVTLHQVVALEPEHLSLYALTLEGGTTLARRVKRGEVIAAEDETAASMYERAEQILAEAGFFHYEISNWAKVRLPAPLRGTTWWPHQILDDRGPVSSEHISDRVCRHNLTYWRNEPWLGLGAGAHSWMTSSFLRRSGFTPRESTVGRRWANLDHPHDYVPATQEPGYPGCCWRDVEEIDERLAMGETMMLGLRLAEGISSPRFEARFQVSPADAFGEELDSLRELGLLDWDGVTARLTARGRLLGNRVFERFV